MSLSPITDTNILEMSHYTKVQQMNKFSFLLTCNNIPTIQSSYWSLINANNYMSI